MVRPERNVAYVPVARVVAGSAVVALYHDDVAGTGPGLVELCGQAFPEVFIHIGCQTGLVAEVVHHGVELHGARHVVAVFVVVVHGINLGDGLLECLEVFVENGCRAGALRRDERFDAVI